MAFQFSVKPPMFEDEGALHYSRGKFLLSISGVKKDKQVSERVRNIAIVSAVVVVIAILVIATILAGHQANRVPYEIQLRESLGQPIENVAKNMELDIGDFEQVSPGVYSLKDGCRLSGVPFSITLHFGEKDALLNGFEYLAEYDAGISKAASDLYKIAIDLRMDITKPEGLDGIKLTRGGLKDHFKNNALSVQYSSNFTPFAGNSAEQYLRQLEASEDWEGRVGEYLTKNAVYYEDIDVKYTPESERVYIRIAYVIEPDRSKM